MKTVLVVIALPFLFRLSGGGLISAFPRALEEPVAIVCFLSGKAFAKFDNKRTELGLFQRLRPGTFLESDRGSKVVVAFFTGDCYEFGERAFGTIGRAGVEGKKGRWQKLAPVPALIDIAPIAREENPGGRLAAARIRTGDEARKSISNLYPSGGAATVAQTALLHFEPVEGYQKYKVDVEDESGNVVFSKETPSPTVQISPGVLRPGTNYYWRARTLDAEKPVIRGGEAFFVTLNEDAARRRGALKPQAEATRDVAMLALLAEVDYRLGLRWEACEGLKAALDQSPGNRPIKEALERFGCIEPEGSAKQRE